MQRSLIIVVGFWSKLDGTLLETRDKVYNVQFKLWGSRNMAASSVLRNAQEKYPSIFKPSIYMCS